MTLRDGTSDRSVYRQVFERRIYEVDLTVPPRLILDLGAYTGLSTRWFRDTYPGAHVIAVEPDPESAALIEVNAPGAEIHRVAVGAVAGRVPLYRPRGIHQCSTICPRDGLLPVGTVEAVTVDTILAGRTPDLLKVDIEGAELAVFSRPCPWLGTVAALLVETHDRFVPGCRKAVAEAVAATRRPVDWIPRGGPNAVALFYG